MNLPNGIRLESSQLRGRYLVADRPFSPGDVVVSQLPYAAVLFTEHITRFCNYCFRDGMKLSRCSRSKFAHYCRRECQLKDWQDGYKYECEFLQKCSPRSPPDSTRLAARVVWKRQREVEKAVDATDLWNTYHGIDCLDDHFEDLNPHRLQGFAGMGFFIARLCPHLPDSGFDLNESIEKSLARLVAKFAFNNHTISSSSATSLGCGVYPLLAMVNHSSSPNCIQRFNELSPGVMLRAISPIKPGEELTITYLDLVSTSIERRDILKDAYLFDTMEGMRFKKPNRSLRVNSGLVAEIWKNEEPSWVLSDKDRKLSEVVKDGEVCGGVMVVAVPPDSRLLSELESSILKTDQNSARPEKMKLPVVVQMWGKWTQGRFDAKEVSKKVLEGHSLLIQGKDFMEAGTMQEALDTFQKVLHLFAEPLHGEYTISERHIFQFKAMDFTLKTAVEVGTEWDLALTQCRKMQSMLDILYPHYWSERGSQLAVLAKLESNFGDLKRAVEAAEEAVHVMRITDGKSDVLDTMKELSSKLKRELDYVSKQNT